MTDGKIIRKPVQTRYMRRDSAYNPEYLDPERLTQRFRPLIENVTRRLRPWYASRDNEQDTEDLRQIVTLEFLRLRDRYNPAYGMDFPGYIKLNLERRVRYFVLREAKRAARELLQPSPASDTTAGYIDSVADERADSDIERVNRVLSVPVDEIDNDFYRDIIKRVLTDGADVHALAREYGVSPRSMSAKLDAAGKYVRALMERENGSDEEEIEAGAGDAADAEDVGIGEYDGTDGSGSGI